MNPHPRLALIGLGKMGQTLRYLAPERGCIIAAEIGAEGNERGMAITRESLRDADVAIEFTTPESAPWNVRACARAGCPVVVGTTGWDAERSAVEREVLTAGGAMLAAPNLSLGVNVFFQIAEYAARLTGRLSAFDAHIVETHHAAKRDAPSGTALELARRTSAARQLDIPISSIRTGNVPGTHTLLLDGGFEQISLEHVARDRRVFADGAMTAAGWLIGKHGIFTMTDFLMDVGLP
jgi:4-hydroxy-tetrahydrodipicolinate reductase